MHSPVPVSSLQVKSSPMSASHPSQVNPETTYLGSVTLQASKPGLEEDTDGDDLATDEEEWNSEGDWTTDCDDCCTTDDDQATRSLGFK